MARRALYHVTLTTGHVRRSTRDEISPPALDHCRALLARVLAPDAPPQVILPALGDYTLGGRASGRCLVAIVRAPHEHDPLATIGVATHSRCGARLWRELHTWGQTLVVTDPDRCPPEPWLAVTLDSRAVAHPEAMDWLGDFERSLGWAWLDLVEARRDG